MGGKALIVVVWQMDVLGKSTELFHNELSSRYFVVLEYAKNIDAFVQFGEVEFLA